MLPAIEFDSHSGEASNQSGQRVQKQHKVVPKALLEIDAQQGKEENKNALKQHVHREPQ